MASSDVNDKLDQAMDHELFEIVREWSRCTTQILKDCVLVVFQPEIPLTENITRRLYQAWDKVSEELPHAPRLLILPPGQLSFLNSDAVRAESPGYEELLALMKQKPPAVLPLRAKWVPDADIYRYTSQPRHVGKFERHLQGEIRNLKLHAGETLPVLPSGFPVDLSNYLPQLVQELTHLRPIMESAVTLWDQLGIGEHEFADEQYADTLTHWSGVRLDPKLLPAARLDTVGDLIRKYAASLPPESQEHFRLYRQARQYMDSLNAWLAEQTEGPEAQGLDTYITNLHAGVLPYTFSDKVPQAMQERYLEAHQDIQAWRAWALDHWAHILITQHADDSTEYRIVRTTR
jgi:hypothetical protein